MTTEDNQARGDVLIGKSNYVGWYNKISAVLEEKGIMNDDGEINPDVPASDARPAIKYDKMAYTYIILRVHDKIAQKVSCDKSGSALLKFLKDNYAGGNIYELRNKFDDFKMNDGHTDAIKYLELLDALKANAKQAGVKIHPRDEFRKLVDHVNPEFYRDYIRKMRIDYALQLDQDTLKAEHITAVREYLIMFYNATPKPTKRFGNHVNEKAFKTHGKFEERHCSKCQMQFGEKTVQGKKIKIYETHHTHDCRMKTDDSSSSNKEDSAYFDTCASAHFVNKMPTTTIDHSVQGTVASSTGHTTKIVGSANFSFGSAVIKANISPGLDSNLMSGGKLIKDGYCAILKKDENKNDLKIYKDDKSLHLDIKGEIVATGHINDNNMIKLNEPLVTNNYLAYKTCKYGHELTDAKECVNCLTAIRRRNNVPKRKGRTYDPLEKISLDTQGPFSIKGIDGSKYNLKLVDSKSKYITTVLMTTKSSTVTKNIFEHYLKRMQRQTAKTLKKVSTDGGSEFYGDFLDFLEDNGIQKVRGAAYEHSYPADAENANRIINLGARTSLHYSKLPLNYWPYAILYATYIYNRTGDPCPYEILFSRKPRINHIHAFGSICYAYFPQEKRDFKFDAVRKRCRLLGYADDDEVETMDGYILLEEDSKQVIYIKDVVFSKELPTPLPDVSTDDAELFIYDDDNNDEDYIPEYTETDLSGNTLNSIETSNTESIPVSDMENNEIDEQFMDDRPRRRQNIRPNYRIDIDTDDEENDLVHNNHQAFKTCHQDITVPRNYSAMLKDKDKEKWLQAVNEEMKNMVHMGVWQADAITMSLPEGERAIDSTWTFAKKENEDGTTKFKARLCGRGFREIYGIDYEEVFAPTIRQKVVRTITAIAASNKWHIFSDDMKAAYLNVKLEKGRWLQLPDGRFVEIWRALYGLKESARLWFQTFRDFLISIGFTQSKVEPCVFTRGKLIVAIFVDDTLSTGPDNEIQEFRKALHAKFKVSKEGGICKQFLSIDMVQGKRGIYLCQNKYLEDKLELYKHNIHDNPNYQVASPLLPSFQTLLLQAEKSNETEHNFPYREMVGSLGYLANGTRFDITAALSIVSRFCNSPKKIHCEMVRRIYQYLRGSRRCLFFPYGLKIIMTGYCDSSFANLEDYTSLAGYCLQIGGCMISWKSQKQPNTLSTAEAEYIALTSAVQENLWLKQLLASIGYHQNTPTIFEDNKSCIALTKNPQEKSRTRHIQVKYHWIRDELKKGTFKLEYIPSDKQDADIFTKGMHGPQIRSICQKLNLYEDSEKQGEN